MDTEFGSVERLVEFGLGMAVANQMIATMNQAIGSMTVPGAQAPMGGAVGNPLLSYFVVVDGAQAGPFNEQQLEQLIREGKVTGESLVWRTGITAWVTASNLPDVNRLLLLNKK